MCLNGVVMFGIVLARVFDVSSFVFSVAGYEVYLVGGCVRDLILKRTPKDFDILTSAELREVML